MSDIKDRGWRNFDGKERSIWKDLAPEITRQRLIIEGTLHKSFESENMVKYCENISKVLNMTPIGEVVTDFAEEYGWCAYMHWKESGMHVYSWNVRDPAFFSVDIYTCKKFDPTRALVFTINFFKKDLVELAWKK
jgi:S-adenosylmethionine/arginine decarboxylase-like enzyme